MQSGNRRGGIVYRFRVTFAPLCAVQGVAHFVTAGRLRRVAVGFDAVPAGGPGFPGPDAVTNGLSAGSILLGQSPVEPYFAPAGLRPELDQSHQSHSLGLGVGLCFAPAGPRPLDRNDPNPVGVSFGQVSDGVRAGHVVRDLPEFVALFVQVLQIDGIGVGDVIPLHGQTGGSWRGAAHVLGAMVGGSVDRIGPGPAAGAVFGPDLHRVSLAVGQVFDVVGCPAIGALDF